MPKFVLTYHGGPGEMPSDPAVMEEIMAAWGTWFESIGADLIDGGNPFASNTAIDASGAVIDAPTPDLSGFTVINAANVEAAIEVARRSPVLAGGSLVQVSEAIDM